MSLCYHDDYSLEGYGYGCNDCGAKFDLGGPPSRAEIDRLADLVTAGRSIDTEMTRQHAARVTAACNKEMKMADEETGAHCTNENTMTREDHLRMAALDMALRSFEGRADRPASDVVASAETFAKFLRGA